MYLVRELTYRLECDEKTGGIGLSEGSQLTSAQLPILRNLEMLIVSCRKRLDMHAPAKDAPLQCPSRKRRQLEADAAGMRARPARAWGHSHASWGHQPCDSWRTVLIHHPPLINPSGLASKADGSLLISDGRCVRALCDGQLTTVATGAVGSQLGSIAIRGDMILVVDRDRIMRLDEKGSSLELYAGGWSTQVVGGS